MRITTALSNRYRIISVLGVGRTAVSVRVIRSSLPAGRSG